MNIIALTIRIEIAIMTKNVMSVFGGVAFQAQQKGKYTVLWLTLESLVYVEIYVVNNETYLSICVCTFVVVYTAAG